jgi:hypothetical protein
LEHLLEAVPDALVGMDQKGVIRFVNRQTASAEINGETIALLVPRTG